LDDEIKNEGKKLETPPVKKPGKKREGWACEFDIRKQENWERLKELLIAGDDAAISDVVKFTGRVIFDFYKDVRLLIRRLLPSLDESHELLLFKECRSVLEHTWYNSLNDVIKPREGKEYPSGLKHLKNAAKLLTKERLKHTIRGCISDFEANPDKRSIDDDEWLKRVTKKRKGMLASSHMGLDQLIEIDNLLGKVSKISRSCFVMKHFSGYSWQEIADEHGYSVRSMLLKYNDNKSHFQRLLDDEQT